jgi:hypothetical protein
MTRAATEPRSRISFLPRSNASGSGSTFPSLVARARSGGTARVPLITMLREVWLPSSHCGGT